MYKDGMLHLPQPNIVHIHQQELEYNFNILQPTDIEHELGTIYSNAGDDLLASYIKPFLIEKRHCEKPTK